MTPKRYTSEEMAEYAARRNRDHFVTSSMLRQASETEAQVMGLVEQAYREGFRDGMVDSVADESGIGGIGEDAYWSGSNASEALSKLRGGE